MFIKRGVLFNCTICVLSTCCQITTTDVAVQKALADLRISLGNECCSVIEEVQCKHSANVNCIKKLQGVLNDMLYTFTDVFIKTPIHIKRYWCGSMSKNQGICSSMCKSVLENENPRAARFHSIWVQTRNVIQLGRFKKVYKNRWIPWVPRLASTLPARKWPSVGKRRGPTQTCTVIVC